MSGAIMWATTLTALYNAGLQAELQGAGSRFDALIAVRNAQLAHLDRLLQLRQLWLDSQAEDKPGPQR